MLFFTKKFSSGIGCLIAIILGMLLMAVTIGAWSVQTIGLWFGVDIPFIIAAVISYFTAEFTLPIAIVGSLILLCV